MLRKKADSDRQLGPAGLYEIGKPKATRGGAGQDGYHWGRADRCRSLAA
jgi:hypothetical protein